MIICHSLQDANLSIGFRQWISDQNAMYDPMDTGDHAADVARRLRETRLALQYPDQDEFGENAGLEQSRYNRFESGKRVISLQAAMALNKAYGISLDWLYLGNPSGLDPRLWSRIRELRRAPHDKI